ncbi:YadA C-terminal domain-containing protein, partial [Citrobacter amalonaticus]
ITTETTERKDADIALDNKIDNEAVVRADADKALGDRITTETTERKEADVKLSGRIDVAQSSADKAQDTADYAHSRVDAANANIEANRQALVNTNKRVADNTARLANHEQRIQSLESNTNARFADIDKRIKDVKENANAAIASVAAMANIPQVTGNQSFSVGAGVGARGSQQAVAVGFSARITENVVTKVSVGADTRDQFTVGTGISYGW